MILDDGLAVQRVHFCSGMTFTTGDEISLALLRYVEAVAMTGSSDVTTVPVAGASPGASTVTLLVNKTTQISSEPVAFDGPELLDAPFVERLSGLTSDLVLPAMWDGSDPFSHAADHEA